MDPRLKTETDDDRQWPESVDEIALNRFEAGEGSLAAALHLSGDDLQHIRDRALTLLVGGRYGDARGLLEALMALGDDDPGVRLLLAGACDHLGDIEAAREHLDATIERCTAVGAEELKRSAMEFGEHLGMHDEDAAG